jgi:hypothetical protein
MIAALAANAITCMSRAQMNFYVARKPLWHRRFSDVRKNAVRASSRIFIAPMRAVFRSLEDVCLGTGQLGRIHASLSGFAVFFVVL